MPVDPIETKSLSSTKILRIGLKRSFICRLVCGIITTISEHNFCSTPAFVCENGKITATIPKRTMLVSAAYVQDCVILLVNFLEVKLGVHSQSFHFDSNVVFVSFFHLFVSVFTHTRIFTRQSPSSLDTTYVHSGKRFRVRFFLLLLLFLFNFSVVSLLQL